MKAAIVDDSSDCDGVNDEGSRTFLQSCFRCRCLHMPEPPHSLQNRLSLPCVHIAEPPQSRHEYLEDGGIWCQDVNARRMSEKKVRMGVRKGSWNNIKEGGTSRKEEQKGGRKKGRVLRKEQRKEGGRERRKGRTSRVCACTHRCRRSSRTAASPFLPHGICGS